MYTAALPAACTTRSAIIQGSDAVSAIQTVAAMCSAKAGSKTMAGAAKAKVTAPRLGMGRPRGAASVKV